MRWSRRRHQRARRQQRVELERAGISTKEIAATGMTRLRNFGCIARTYNFRWNTSTGQAQATAVHQAGDKIADWDSLSPRDRDKILNFAANYGSKRPPQ